MGFMAWQSDLENISLQESLRVYAHPCSIMLVPKVHKEENIQDHLNFPLATNIALQVLKNSVGKRGNEYTVTSHIFKNASLIQSSSL